MNRVGGRGPTVLVVDDEPDLCEIVRRMLDGRGYQVLTAGGVSDALARRESHQGPIELLVTDVRMPDGSGPELAEKIRQAHPGTAVLYVSGLPADAGALTEVVEAGTAILAKPFTPTELFVAVESALNGH